MKKDVMIAIKGVQMADGEADTVELFTVGSFYRKDDTYYIDYDETDATGYEGCTTTVTVEPDQRITMSRHGPLNSHLVVEQGMRHQCIYDTGFGPLEVGVMGERLMVDLDDNGGRVEFAYSLDINTTLASENTVTIDVKEAPSDALEN